MFNVNDSGAGPASLYTISQNGIELPSPDTRLHNSTSPTNEWPCSADFSIEFGDPMDLDAPSAHALSARMVARMRKRPLTTTPVDANVAKKHKTFVTNDKGAVIATGF